MNARLFSIVVAAAAAAAYVAIAATIPYRRRRAAERSGELLHKIPDATTKFRTAAIFALCAAIIALTPMQNFQPFVRVIMAAAALLGARSAAAEAVAFGRSGIYRNAVVCGAASFRPDEIISLPTLAYEDDPETVGVDRTQIQVILQSGRKISLPFPNENERGEALAAILSLRPELKGE